MDSRIKVVEDEKRGCGWRTTKGALYVMGGGESAPCELLPIPLTECPCCSSGIKFSRGWTWVDGEKLIKFGLSQKDVECTSSQCFVCPLNAANLPKLGRIGLMWVGKKSYPTTAHFSFEADRLGVSRRIPHIPDGFKVGETWIALAHLEAVQPDDWGDKAKPGIFRVFRPDRIEVICDGTETSEVIDGYLARGLTPVLVNRKGTDLSGDGDDE